jgi:hypothetical protein
MEHAVKEQPYLRPIDLASAEHGLIVALVPYLIGGEPNEDLVAIATGPEGPVLVTATSLHRLSDEDTCYGFGAALARSGADFLWLIGIADDPADVARAVGQAADSVDGKALIESATVLIVTDRGTKWALAADYTNESDTSVLQPVPFIDPAWAQLKAIAMRAQCARNDAHAALTIGPEADDFDDLAAAADLIAGLRASAQSGDPASHAHQDITGLEKALATIRPVSATEAINLGFALTASGDLYARAANRILEATTNTAARCDLWYRLTQHALGERRAVCASLAALAAWRTSDATVAHAAAAIAAQAPELASHAAAACEIVTAGVAAADMDCRPWAPTPAPTSRTEGGES